MKTFYDEINLIEKSASSILILFSCGLILNLSLSLLRESNRLLYIDFTKGDSSILFIKGYNEFLIISIPFITGFFAGIILLSILRKK